jgi:hypothetical protein
MIYLDVCLDEEWFVLENTNFFEHQTGINAKKMYYFNETNKMNN